MREAMKPFNPPCTSLLFLMASLLAACGGGNGPSWTDSAADAPRAQALASVSAEAAAGAPVITATGIIGYGTTLRSDGGFLSTGPTSAFPMTRAGTVAINTVISDYGDPNPRSGFLLTSDGLNRQFVTAGGTGQLLHYGFAISDLDTLTYQRGPVNSGTPPAYQFFTQPAPYGTVSPYSPACACNGIEVQTNRDGVGVALLRTSDFNVPSVVRFDGQGATQALAVDPTYLGGAPLSKTKILDSGAIYVGLLNLSSQNFEIWRFESGQSQTHSVAYAKAASSGALLAWDVNESGTLAVAEASEGSGASPLVKVVATDGTASVVPGTPFTAFGATYSSVFINRAGVVAAFRSSQADPNSSSTEMLYAKPGASAMRVLGVGDTLNGGRVLSLAASSEISDGAQLTVFAFLDISPASPPTTQTVVRVNPFWVPSITSFAPSSAPAGGTLVITGADFNGASAVTFNGIDATGFSIDSPSQVTVTVPLNATSGPIAVTGPAGTGTSASSFTVATGPAPTIAGFAPSSGGIGSSVTIKGSNLAGASAVLFNGVAASFKAKGGSQLVAVVPLGATNGTIVVQTPGGTATSTTNFIVVPAPSISGVSPASGAVGTLVTISGSALAGATSVMFGGAKASFTVVSAQTLTALVPKAGKDGPITVTSPGGSAASAGFDVIK
jgi:hypothetical protein